VNTGHYYPAPVTVLEQLRMGHAHVCARSHPLDKTPTRVKTPTETSLANIVFLYYSSCLGPIFFNLKSLLLIKAVRGRLPFRVLPFSFPVLPFRFPPHHCFLSDSLLPLILIPTYIPRLAKIKLKNTNTNDPKGIRTRDPLKQMCS
jgi:hypothetical protein